MEKAACLGKADGTAIDIADRPPQTFRDPKMLTALGRNPFGNN
jgi:hypothetical protein